MPLEKKELTTRSIPRRSPQSSLTAVIGREPVFSRRYGSEHVCLKRKCFSINSIFCIRIGKWHGKKKSSRHEVFLGGFPSKF